MKVVFDLDGTITQSFDDRSLQRIQAEFSFVYEFEKCGLLIHAMQWHIIFPGVIELLQLLDRAQVRIAFFSAGASVRNDLLVEHLLKLALGEARYLELLPTLKILSRDDLVQSPHSKLKIKDLSKALEADEHMSNVILIDDNSNYSHPDQIINLLLLPYSPLLFDFDDVYTPRDSNVELQVIIKKVNAIFYISGMLLETISKARCLQLTLKDALFSLQYKDCGNGDYERFFNRLYDPESRCPLDENEISAYFSSVFEHGERLLQTANPELRMVEVNHFFSERYRVHLPENHMQLSIRRELIQEENIKRGINVYQEEFMKWGLFHRSQQLHLQYDEERSRQECEAEFENTMIGIKNSS